MTVYPITRRHVPDMLVASIRFSSEERDSLPDRFKRLRARVEPFIVGPRIVLYHHDSPEMEVCYPVSEPVDKDEVHSYELGGVEMVITTHTGPHEGVSAAWGAIRDYLNEHSLGLSNHPSRAVYRIDSGDPAQYVTELQRPLMLPVWLERMARGLESVVGRTGRDFVLTGAEHLINGHTPAERAEWAIGAIERLDAAVPAEDDRAAIMMGCTHRFPDMLLEQFRAEYARLDGDVRALIPIVHPDPVFHAPELHGNVLHVSKVPADAEAYAAATTDVERRAAYCHCPLIHAAIRAEQPVSRTYCYCGAGWFQQIWGGILGQPVKVEVLESVVVGDDRCRFAVHLPPEVL